MPLRCASQSHHARIAGPSSGCGCAPGELDERAEPSARSRAPRPRAGQLPPPRRPAELLPGEPRPAGARTARAVASGRPAPVPRRAAAPQGAARGPRSPLRGLDRAGPRLHRRRRLRRRAEHRARGGRARRAGRVRALLVPCRRNVPCHTVCSTLDYEAYWCRRAPRVEEVPSAQPCTCVLGLARSFLCSRRVRLTCAS